MQLVPTDPIAADQFQSSSFKPEDGESTIRWVSECVFNICFYLKMYNRNHLKSFNLWYLNWKHLKLDLLCEYISAKTGIANRDTKNSILFDFVH
jgi:hypothetical protein